jgi:hypothetical protein
MALAITLNITRHTMSDYAIENRTEVVNVLTSRVIENAPFA